MDRAAWQIGLGVLALGLFTTRGLASGDAAIHLDVAVSLVERGSADLTLDPGAHWVPTEARAGGLWVQDGDTLRSVAAPGMAWLALPLAALAGRFTDAPLAQVLRPLFEGGALDALQGDPRVIAFAFLGPLMAAIAVAFTWRAAGALGLRRGRWWAALALGLGSPLLAYAGTGWTQLPVAAAFAVALHGLARPPDAGRGRRVAAPVALAALVRPDALVLGLPMLAVAWPRARAGDRAALVALPALALAVVAAWGTPLSGGAWAVDGALEGAAGLLLSPRTGLVVYAPFALLAPLGLRRLGVLEPGGVAAVAVATPLLGVALYAGWFDWGASLAYGPRFLVPALPVLALAFGAAAERLAPRLAALPVAVGFAVQLPGALVQHARIEEPARFLHPTFASAWRALLEGGPDVVALAVPAYPVAIFLVALAGLGLGVADRALIDRGTRSCSARSRSPAR